MELLGNLEAKRHDRHRAYRRKPQSCKPFVGFTRLYHFRLFRIAYLIMADLQRDSAPRLSHV